MTLYYNSHSNDRRTQKMWRRMILQPYEDKTLQFTGVPIDHIKYGPHLQQVVMASIYGCKHYDIEIDHVCIIIHESHINQFPLFEPITFYATIHKYKTMEYVHIDNHAKTLPAMTTNYTLINPRHVKTTIAYQLKHPALSSYIKNRLEILKLQSNENIDHLQTILEVQSNDGRREEFIAPYLNALGNGVNRVSIHGNLHK